MLNINKLHLKQANHSVVETAQQANTIILAAFNSDVGRKSRRVATQSGLTELALYP